MAKKKAPRRARRAARPSARKAVRTASSRARTAIKKVARRAAAARKSAKTAIKKAARAGSGMKKAAAKRAKAVTKQVTAATKQVKAVAKQVRVQQQSVAQTAAKTATTALGKAATLAKAVKAGVTAALTSPAAAAAAKSRPKRPPSLDRERRTVQEIHGAPSTLGPKAGASAAKSGGDEFRQKLKEHTSSSPALTAGDVDADWESADSAGDEAPGGDNPTPDQDVVDEIGRALGVEYDDDEELQGGDEIASRDRHRWELDPNSAEDTEDRD